MKSDGQDKIPDENVTSDPDDSDKDDDDGDEPLETFSLLLDIFQDFRVQSFSLSV